VSKCFLIDGLNLIFRCFYGIPLLSAQKFPTNAIFGSVKILSKIIDLEKPSHIAIFFDKGRDPQRQSLLPEYKANRIEMPDPVKIQIPVIKEFAYALGYTVIERSGIEADDLIASFAHKYRNNFDSIYIFSTDKDFAQCIGENIYQIIPGSDRESMGSPLDSRGIMEKFGVLPEQIVDYLSLIGDQADNIPGIRGVGPKTANLWLKQFGNIQTLLSQIAAIKPARFQSIIGESGEILHRNQRLITLDKNIENVYLEENTPDEEAYDQLIDLYQLISLRKQRKEEQLVQGDLFL
jgi:DNA polymerase-1